MKSSLNRRKEIFWLEIAKILEVRQQMGDVDGDNRLCCKIEMSTGGQIDNVPFASGGIDLDTKFPHGIFIPPRKEQLVGVLFLRGRNADPVSCFSIPYQAGSLKDQEGIDLYSNIMEDLDDITLFHFSGSRVHMRKDGTIEFAKKIGDTSYAISLKIEDTDKKKTITDLDNSNVITMDSNGIKILAKGDTDSKSAARKDDEVKSTSTEDSSYWSWIVGLQSALTIFSTGLNPTTLVAQAGALVSWLEANPAPTSLTGKITKASNDVSIGGSSS
jgi:hypothetical protein